MTNNQRDSLRMRNEMMEQDNQESDYNDLWTDELICAFELVHGYKKVKTAQQVAKEVVKKQVCSSDHNGWSSEKISENSLCELLQLEPDDSNNGRDCDHNCHLGNFNSRGGLPRNCWMPIGWDRISELVQTVQCLATGICNL